MMIIDVRDVKGDSVGEVDLRDDIFGIEPNVSVMHQAFVRQQANARQGTHKAKTRGEVRGTTAKWYRQKGTGRARHGDRKAPIFVGGGKAHGPRPRDYTQRMPRKMRRLALRSALSAKVASDEMVVVNELVFDTSKTANAVEFLKSLDIQTSAVILLPDRNENVEKSVHNLPFVKTLRANYLNIRDILGHDYIIVPQESISVIESFLG
jgi:large subunit ribosomal protein L4